VRRQGNVRRGLSGDCMIRGRGLEVTKQLTLTLTLTLALKWAW